MTAPQPQQRKPRSRGRKAPQPQQRKPRSRGRKGPGRPALPATHQCTAACKHQCYEFGGMNEDGTWCRRLQGDGIVGFTPGMWGSYCSDHVETLPTHLHAILEGLTINERKFVAIYCGPARGNAALAARMIGLPAATADIAGQNLRRRDKIRIAIDAWLNVYGLSTAELTAAIADTAMASMRPFTRVNGKGKPEIYVTPEDWDRYGHWVKSITVGPGGEVTLSLVDAAAARRDMAKIRRLYSEAPQLNLYTVLMQASDEEILRQLEEARQQIASGPKLITAGGVTP